jgi:hypothetical protein
MAEFFQKYRAQGILVFFILVFIGYHYWGYIGHYGYDDMEYAMLASDWTRGIFHPGNHFSYRMTITGLTALAYMVFGVSDFASALPPMLVTIGILWLVYRILKHFGAAALFAGLAFTLSASWFIFYADKLMPDIYVAFSVIAALYVLYKDRFEPALRSHFIHPLLFVLALFFGFLSKGTLILALPLFALVFLVDVAGRQHLRFWSRTWGIGVIVLALYFLGCHILTGNAFARFDALYANSYLHQCSYDQQPLPILLERIYRAFFERMLSSGMVTSYFFILPLVFSRRGRKVILMREPLHFFATAAFVLLLLANFMSISLSAYSPMCVDQRHYLYLIPVAAIPAGIVLSDFLSSKALRWQIILALLIGTSFSWFVAGNTFHKLYLPLLVISVLYALVPLWPWKKWLYLSIFGGVLALMPMEFVQFAGVLDYRRQREIFHSEIVHPNPEVYVITDVVSKHLGMYYGGYDQDQNYTLLRFGFFDFDTLDSRPKWVYLNGYNQGLSGLSEADLPRYIKNEAEGHNLIFEDEQSGIRILQLDESLNLMGEGRSIYETQLDFEGQIETLWSENPELRRDSISHSGHWSALAPEYSSSFRIELDSLQLSEFDILKVDASVYANTGAPTSASVVVTVSNGDTTLFWDSYSVNRPMKAYGFWWEVTAEKEFRMDALPPGAVLSVYVWNKDLDALYLDDFKVQLVGVKDRK